MRDLAKLLSARVPRYTSYPTAVQFHEGIGGDRHRQWLGALPEHSSLSLYFHIPFCRQLCWFCGCHTHVANTYRPVEAYLELLKLETEMVAAAIPDRHAVEHIHWGGGSPTILKPEDIERLAGGIRDSFRVVADTEFAVEVDPRTITREMARAFTAAGATRASLGVQDCDMKVLNAVNRVQTIETTRRAVDMLREHGVARLNIDLMYGLPFQTVDGVRRTIDEVHKLSPDRLAVFGYAHLPGFKAQQSLIDEAALPSLDDRLEQYEAGRTHLQSLGYVAIGLDHFARESDPLTQAFRRRRLSRNFQGYTTDTASALVGLGSSAISALPDGYTQNAVAMPAYRKAVMNRALATSRGIGLTAEDKLRRAVISDLMCYGQCDLAITATRFGFPASCFAPDMPTLNGLMQDGLVRMDGQSITIVEGAHAAVRMICAVFDRYLAPTQTRHATAV